MTNKTHVPYIFLIIASHDPAYDAFTELWNSYMNNFNDIKCFFVYSNPLLNVDLQIDGNCIYHKSEESLCPGILLKTLGAMSYVLENYTFDYLCRTNLSTFFNFNIMLNFFKEYKDCKPDAISVLQLFYRTDFSFNYNWRLFETTLNKYFPEYMLSIINQLSKYFFNFLDGCCMFLSYEMVNLLVKMNIDPCLLELPDDIALSFMYYYSSILHKNSINITNISYHFFICQRLLLSNNCSDIDFIKSNNIFIVRNNINHIKSANRYIDIANYSTLCTIFNKPKI